MPLRAQLDGLDLIAPSLTASEWESLRRDVRAEKHSLVLPCCGSVAFQRVSPRGLQHFYHRPDSGCPEEVETVDHLHAKLAIARGCEAAGYRACVESSGEGWRADVLAVRGAVRVAFEVQWSPQTLEETLLRQRRYSENGVRGCWFFRTVPEGLRRLQDTQLVEAREDLPLFLLHQEHHDASRVYLNGSHHPLDSFVAALLAGKIQFRPKVWIPRFQPVTINFFDVGCWRCGCMSQVYCLDKRSYASPCGVEVALHRGAHDSARPALRKEVQRAVWAYLQTDEGLRLRVGSIKKRAINGKERTCFGCFHCDAPFGDHALWKLEETIRRREAWTATHDTEVAMAGSFKRERPHWCYALDGEFC